MNLYEILNVDRDASQYKIRKSYIELAKVYHPDKMNSSKDDDIFKLIETAYGVLSDPLKRHI